MENNMQESEADRPLSGLSDAEQPPSPSLSEDLDRLIATMERLEERHTTPTTVSLREEDEDEVQVQAPAAVLADATAELLEEASETPRMSHAWSRWRSGLAADRLASATADLIAEGGRHPSLTRAFGAWKARWAEAAWQPTCKRLLSQAKSAAAI